MLEQFSAVCFLSLWPLFIWVLPAGGSCLLSGQQEKSLGCLVGMLASRCEVLLNSSVHKRLLMIKALCKKLISQGRGQGMEEGIAESQAVSGSSGVGRELVTASLYPDWCGRKTISYIPLIHY